MTDEKLVERVAVAMFACSVTTGNNPMKLWETSATDKCHQGFREAARAAIDAYEAAKGGAGTVAIKPLEWGASPGTGVRARSIVGPYVVVPWHVIDRFKVSFPHGISDYAPTEEAAKAAAQADYEARIRSALAHQPDDAAAR